VLLRVGIAVAGPFAVLLGGLLLLDRVHPILRPGFEFVTFAMLAPGTGLWAVLPLFRKWWVATIFAGLYFAAYLASAFVFTVIVGCAIDAKACL